MASPIVARLVEQGIAVMGHIGLTPQAVHRLGGYYRHGKTDAEAQELIAAAGSGSDLVGECDPPLAQGLLRPPCPSPSKTLY